MNKADLFPPAGRPRKLHMEVVRELTAEDLRALRTPAACASGPPPLQKLRASHHQQAKLLAEGKKIVEVAAIVGVTPERIHQLQHDPAFIELVAYYQDQIMSAALDDARRVQGKLVDIAEMAVDELSERLEDEGARKAMPIGELRKIAEMGLDRTVAPPKATSSAPPPPTAITLNFGSAIANLGPQSQHSATIDITPEENK